MYLFSFFLLVSTIFAALPTREDIDKYFNPTTHFYPKTIFDDNIDYYANGKHMSTGIVAYTKITKGFSDLLPRYQNTLLQYHSTEDTIVVYRFASCITSQGKMINFYALDIFTFNDKSKCVKRQTITDRPLEEILESANSKQFSQSEIKQLAKEKLCYSRTFHWTKEDVESIGWTDDVEVNALGFTIKGKKDFYDYVAAVPYKLITGHCDDLFAVDNTVYVPRVLHYETHDGCVFQERDVIKVTFNFPDGKISKWENIIMGENINKDHCFKQEKKEL